MVSIVSDYHDAMGITHSGSMHDDDVFATAFLDLYFLDFKVARVNEVALDISSDVIVYDINKKEFDHHQMDARVRDNGIKYSSFGLIFEKYGKSYLKRLNVKSIDLVYDYFVKNFVLAIDAIDNGIFPKVECNYNVLMIGELMKIFNPSYLSNDNADEQFLKAVSVAKIILEEEIKQAISRVEANKVVKKLIDNTDDDILILDEYMPYQDALLNSNNQKIKLVIYKTNRTGYGIKTVPRSLTDKSSRVYFKKEWAGKSSLELSKLTGIKGCVFCHINRFLMITEDLESAIKIAKLTIKINEQS